MSLIITTVRVVSKPNEECDTFTLVRVVLTQKKYYAVLGLY